MEGFETKYQSVAFTATSASSTAISAGLDPAYVLLYATQDCHIRSTILGSAALITDTFVPSNTQTPFYITPGNIISVIQDTTSGTLHISPVA